MILFPFRTVYLKTNKLRKEIVSDMLSNTYLSDAAYKKTDQNKTFFYGSVNDQGFILQNVSHEKITAFIEGNILGVDEDMYIKFRFKGFRSLRIFLLILMLIIGSLGFVGFHLWERNLDSITDIPVLFALGLTLILLFFSLNTGIIFMDKIKDTQAFFCDLLEAEEVGEKDMPGIFL